MTLNERRDAAKLDILAWFESGTLTMDRIRERWPDDALFLLDWAQDAVLIEFLAQRTPEPSELSEMAERALVRAQFQSKFIDLYPDHPWVRKWKEENEQVTRGEVKTRHLPLAPIASNQDAATNTDRGRSRFPDPCWKCVCGWEGEFGDVAFTLVGDAAYCPNCNQHLSKESEP